MTTWPTLRDLYAPAEEQFTGTPEERISKALGKADEYLQKVLGALPPGTTREEALHLLRVRKQLLRPRPSRAKM